MCDFSLFCKVEFTIFTLFAFYLRMSKICRTFAVEIIKPIKIIGDINMITLLDATSHNSESFKSFVSGLKNCKLNVFEHWNYFLSYNLLFTPQRVWERGGIYTSIINRSYDSRGANVKIVKLLKRRDFLDNCLSISTIKIELDEESGKLVLSGDAGYFYSGVLCRGTYRVEIGFVEEMWTADGHYYMGGKVIPITQDMLG